MTSLLVHLRRPEGAAAPPRWKVLHMPLLTVLMAVASGIAVDRCAGALGPASFSWWWLMGAVGLACWLVCYWRGWAIAALLCLLASLVSIGGAWHHLDWCLFDEHELGRYATLDQQPLCIDVRVLSAAAALPPPEYDPLRAIPSSPRFRLDVEAVALRMGRDWQPASGKARMYIDGAAPDFDVGDRLRVFGQLTAPSPPGNPGEFDFADHARGDRELSVIQVELRQCIERISRGSSWNPAHWLAAIRARGNAMLWRYLSRDEAGLAAAVLLGERNEVDRQLNDAFLQTGTIHILSISGLHVGILASLLFLVLRTGWLPRRAALVGVMLITGAYMLLTNAQPPVVRATLLVWIVCGAMWMERPALGLNSLALAALVVLAMNPSGLFRVGVQLSFLSVAVLMTVARPTTRRRPVDPLDRLIERSRPWTVRAMRSLGVRIKELFVAGLVLWLAITPLTMARFHLVSPSALVLNVVFSPMVALALAAGFGVLLFGWFAPPAAAAFGWVCNAALGGMEHVVRLSAAAPGGYFWTSAPNEAWLIGLYAILLAALIGPRIRLPRRWRWALAAGWCGAVVFATLPPARAPEGLRCTFISVGHGNAVLLELPDGRNVLYDGGRLGSPAAAVRSISSVLWSRGIRHLDAVVISHADVDHYNAIPGLAERFSIGAAYVSPMMFQEPAEALRLLRESLQRHGVPIELVFGGDRLRAAEGVKLEVLHPPSTGVAGSDNANSIVLSVEHDGRRILLTGDLEGPGLVDLLAELPYDVDVLLAPHHGSSRSDPARLAEWCTPEWVVASGGRNDRSAESRSAYTERGAQWLHTAHSGAVVASIADGRLHVERFRPASSGPSPAAIGR